MEPDQTQQSMSIDAILDGLRTAGERFPRDELLAAVAQQEAITPRLIEIIEDVVRDPAPYLDDDADLRLLAALHLLAQFRETRACRAMADLFVLDADTFDRLVGETSTDRGEMILAAVCGDEPLVIQAIIENPDAYEYARTAALRALVALVLHGRWPRDEAIAYLRGLLTERLDREPSHVWSAVVSAALDLHPGELLAEIAQAYDEELVEDGYCGDLEVVQTVAGRDVQDVLDEERASPSYTWVTDVIAEMEWWAMFAPPRAPGAAGAGRAPAPLGLPPQRTSSAGARTAEPAPQKASTKADKAKAKTKRKLAKAARRRNR